MSIWEERERFKSVLGHLAMVFAEMEFALLYFIGLIKDPTNYQFEIRNHLGLSLEERRKTIKDYIFNNTPSLKDRWMKINSKIGDANLERRHLMHGIGMSYFFSKEIRTIIKKGSTVDSKVYTIEVIKKNINDICHILNGDDGIQGIFLNDFTTCRLNEYNSNVEESKKIIHRLDGKVITDWKGE